MWGSANSEVLLYRELGEVCGWSVEVGSDFFFFFLFTLVVRSFCCGKSSHCLSFFVASVIDSMLPPFVLLFRCRSIGRTMFNYLLSISPLLTSYSLDQAGIVMPLDLQQELLENAIIISRSDFGFSTKKYRRRMPQ